MPVKTKKVGKKYRVVDTDGKIAKTPNGKPRDGGGHTTKAQATAQCRAINMHLREKGKI